MTTRLRVILVALAVVAGVMLWPATANAATFSGRVSGTGGQGLFVRPGPSRGSGGPMYTLGEGAGVNFDCYVHGEVIAGYWYTGDIWHHLTSGGWVTDTYVYTGYDGPVPGEPVCGGTPPPPAPGPVGPARPTGDVAQPGPTRSAASPRRANTSMNPLKASFVALINGCNARGWRACFILGKHYLDRSGTPATANMGSLIWQERPLWAQLEWQLRHNSGPAVDAAKRTASNSSASVPFDTGWYVYTATQGDWKYALHSFSVRMKGDVWIGPAGPGGVRPIQIRYRSFMFDIYDFRAGMFSQYASLHDQGRAAEFLVTGKSATRFIQTNSSSVNTASLSLEW